jgi:hypothetical protein
MDRTSMAEEKFRGIKIWNRGGAFAERRGSAGSQGAGEMGEE